MAQLFVEDGFEWAVAPLEGNTYALCGNAESSLRPQRVSEDEAGSGPLIERAIDPSCVFGVD